MNLNSKYKLKIVRIYIRILNGLAIRYNITDLINYIRFLIKQNKSFNCELINDFNKNSLEIAVISLKFRTDRREYINKMLNTLHIPFKFFDGFHGKSIPINIKDRINFSSNSLKYLSSGSLGCILSHVKLWETFSKSESELLLVFEDDIIINGDYYSVCDLIKSIPKNFDLVYLGSGSIKSYFNLRHISNQLGKPFSIRKGAYSYLLSKNGARKLLTENKKIIITCGGIDTLLGIATMRKKINTYHVLEDICKVNFNFSSNIQNNSLPTKKIENHEF